MSRSLSTLSPFSSSSSSLLSPKTLNPTNIPFRAPGTRPGSQPFFCYSPRPSKPLIRVPTTRSAAETSSPAAAAAAAAQQVSTASDVVREFYDRINRRDLDGVEVLIGEDCVYEDLIFSRPFVGRKAILDFFKKFTESISPDLQFAIDDISGEDSSAIGVTWHLGQAFSIQQGLQLLSLGNIGRQETVSIWSRLCGACH